MTATHPKITIIGPGSIGSLLGAILARGGHRVFLLDNNPPRAAKRNLYGITIKEKANAWVATPESHCNATDIGASDIIIICTKSYDTAHALENIPPLLNDHTIIVSLQNGIGNAEQLASYAPAHTLCAVTTMGARCINATTTHWTGKGVIMVAPFANTDINDAEYLANILNQPGCKTNTTDDCIGMLWSKLIINATINPVTAIYGITNGELLTHPDAYEDACAIALECTAVARAQGINLTFQNPIPAFTAICKKTAANRSSMLQDMDKDKPTEIEAITGAIIEAATQHAIAVPANKKVFKKIAVHAWRQKA